MSDKKPIFTTKHGGRLFNVVGGNTVELEDGTKIIIQPDFVVDAPQTEPDVKEDTSSPTPKGVTTQNEVDDQITWMLVKAGCDHELFQPIRTLLLTKQIEALESVVCDCSDGHTYYDRDKGIELDEHILELKQQLQEMKDV